MAIRRSLPAFLFAAACSTSSSGGLLPADAEALTGRVSVVLDDPGLLGQVDFTAEVVLERGDPDAPSRWLAFHVGDQSTSQAPLGSFGFGQAEPFALHDSFAYSDESGGSGSAEVLALDGAWHRFRGGAFEISEIAEGRIQFTAVDAEICRGDEDGQALSGDEAPCRSDVSWTLEVGSPEEPVQYEHCDRIAWPIPELCSD